MEVIACTIVMMCRTNDGFPMVLKKENGEYLTHRIGPHKYASIKITCPLTSHLIVTLQPKNFVPENITPSNYPSFLPGLSNFCLSHP